MTLHEAKQRLTQCGCVIKKTGFGNEYRVNMKGGKEETAYYTDDIEDAVATGERMTNIW